MEQAQLVFANYRTIKVIRRTCILLLSFVLLFLICFLLYIGIEHLSCTGFCGYKGESDVDCSLQQLAV